ncbi:hypothetical protein [Kitasatospora sp. LaBMicrA B282]|uniref:hypothetical protein n=1 Tax=Kitasatospora sp. LaBMicrA B282 TaxID=3420949 RepID=UPI003D0A3968
MKKITGLGAAAAVLVGGLGLLVAPQAQAHSTSLHGCSVYTVNGGHRAEAWCSSGTGTYRVKGYCANLGGQARFYGNWAHRTNFVEQSSTWDCGSSAYAEGLSIDY